MSRMRSTALLAAVLALTTASFAQDPAAKSPPDAARPMVRWWWFGPAVVKPEILRELQQMKADGIGGAELAFVYPEQLDDKDIHNLTFLSKEMLDAVNYAQAEGRKLGLRIDVTLCSGWPYGGPRHHAPGGQAVHPPRHPRGSHPRRCHLGQAASPMFKLLEGESILSMSRSSICSPTHPPRRRPALGASVAPHPSPGTQPPPSR